MKWICMIALALTACGGDDSIGGCDGKVTGVTAGPPGTVMVTGDFSQGQPIIEVLSADGTMMDTPAGTYDNSTATFTGLPGGMHSVHWIMSCDNGGQVVISGPGTVTVP